ncbi:MAG: hypothetical protein LAP85_02620 [Acidobacteriia bacterium]|nr:hypothetical protein [Terriglobia bacterium]
MDRKPLNENLDEWLDRALADYGRAEPRAGIETRAVENLRGRLQRRPWRARWQLPVWLSAAAVTIVVFIVMLFVKPEKPPAPDPAKGNDQELLLGVDRLLNKEVPSALEPALVLTKEMVKK